MAEPTNYVAKLRRQITTTMEDLERLRTMAESELAGYAQTAEGGREGFLKLALEDAEGKPKTDITVDQLVSAVESAVKLGTIAAQDFAALNWLRV